MSLYNKFSNIVERNELYDREHSELIDIYKSASIDDKISMLDLLIDRGNLDIAQLFLEIEESEESEFLLFKAEISFFNGDNDTAILYLDAINDDSDAKVRAIILESEIYLSEGLFEVAERKIKSLQNYIKEKGTVKLLLAEFYYSQDDYERAYQNYFEIINDKDYVDQIDHAKFASVAYMMGEFETALSNFNKIQKPELLDPNEFLCYVELLIQNYDFDRARELLNTYLVTHDYVESEVYTRAIEFLMSQNLVDDAKAQLKKALKYDDSNPDLIFLDARMAFYDQNYYRYEQQLYKVLELRPQSFDALEMLTEFKFQNGDYSSVIDLLDQLEALGEYDFSYDWMRAKIAHSKSDWDVAEKLYDRIFSDLNHNAEFLNDYAMFFWESRDFQKVRQALTLAKEKEFELVDGEYLLASIDEQNQ